MSYWNAVPLCRTWSAFETMTHDSRRIYAQVSLGTIVCHVSMLTNSFIGDTTSQSLIWMKRFRLKILKDRYHLKSPVKTKLTRWFRLHYVIFSPFSLQIWPAHLANPGHYSYKYFLLLQIHFYMHSNILPPNLYKYVALEKYIFKNL